jgi:RNA-directed DNA polymerase
MQNRNTCSVNGTEGQTDWNAVNWRCTHRHVRNLRQRIFRASQEGNLKKVRSLQKLMLRSRSNVLVSVRRVTQINAGRNTPGVDKVVIKTPEARGKLADELSTFTPWRAKPARRVYIPKATGKLRPLGIPVVRDRCLQAMVKNALEPFWEARFEGISYGFRPGRGCHDAREKIYDLARPTGRKRWVVDADIRGAFDNIDHEFLLTAIGGVPGRELIKQWLKAGYVDGDVFHETEVGTPQGGCISPLLANIALHGLEEALTVRRTLKNGKTLVTREGVQYDNRGRLTGNRAVVRYADDFVVFCESEDAEQVVTLLTGWLKERGLALSPEKTRIVHLSAGFDFLGFNVRLYKAEKTAKKTGWKLLIKPSKKSVKKIRDRVRDEWFSLRGHRVARVIHKLNPVIRGWANYHRSGVAKRIFNSLDDWMFMREVQYVKQLHPKKSTGWTQARYWGRLNLERKDRWVFGDKETGLYVQKFSWFPIERHTLVEGKASPDDPTLRSYWARRNKAGIKNLVPSKQRVARRQDGVCPRCGESLFNDEELHLHYKRPRSEGGKDTYGNLELVHLFCHQQIHAGGRGRSRGSESK